MSPRQKKKTKYRIPGVIMLLALIAIAIALGIYGLQQAEQYSNTTVTTPTTESNITSTQAVTTSSSTFTQGLEAELNTSSPT